MNLLNYFSLLLNLLLFDEFLYQSRVVLRNVCNALAALSDEPLKAQVVSSRYSGVSVLLYLEASFFESHISAFELLHYGLQILNVYRDWV